MPERRQKAQISAQPFMLMRDHKSRSTGAGQSSSQQPAAATYNLDSE
jgi:hypothetical protein